MKPLKSLTNTALLLPIICGTTPLIAAEVQCLEDKTVCYNPSIIPDQIQRRRETGSVKDEEGSVSRGGRMRGGRMRGGRMRGGRMRGGRMRGGRMRGGRMRGGRMRGGRMRGGRMRGGNMNSLELNGSRLDGLAPILKQEESISSESMLVSQKLPDIIAPLAPQHTGFTITEQPTFYWYMSAPWHGEINLIVNEVKVAEPLLDINGSLSKLAYQADNLYHLKLTDYAISLEPHKEYEWFVTIVRDPEQPSIDAFASGTIRYQMPSKRLSERLKNTPPTQWYRVYAEEGIWYDAIDNLNRQIENQPINKVLQKIRAELIEQVDMPKVAHL